ncbi:hypothetical protein L208DRAFT_1271336 [Tricholoma matsutake]|nr:hypothetical protein L208DRAFT_1271336 [Tricholoma matsutake 945]
MAVCWSSTYIMTSQAESKCTIVDTFVYEIGRDEKELTKQSKIDSLQLSHADNAQQAFSSDRGTTLHLALPALEALHKAWTKRVTHSKYRDFVPMLEAGLAKIEEYYDHTADSDAYTFGMLLDLSNKTEHICKFWGDEKLKRILKNTEVW